MTLLDFINEGGIIMYILICLNIIGMSILLWKFIICISFKKQINTIKGEIVDLFPNKSDLLGNKFYKDIVDDHVHNKVENLETGLSTVKIIASIAPLLGLLGTVIGILSAFIVVSEKGLSDPTLFAKGISLALITTVGGLIVAIPHLVGYNYLTRMIDKLEIKLEKLVRLDLFNGDK